MIPGRGVENGPRHVPQRTSGFRPPNTPVTTSKKPSRRRAVAAQEPAAPAKSENASGTTRIGERLRELRLSAGMTPAKLAELTEIPRPQLADYEADRVLPSLGELANLAKALGASLGSFFQRGLAEKRVEMVRAHERWKVPPLTPGAEMLNYNYQALSYRLSDKIMSPFFIEIPPHQTAPYPSRHEGEEFLFLLAGRVLAIIDDKSYELHPGDSLYFDSRLPHAIIAEGDQPALLIAVVAAAHREVEENPVGRAFGEERKPGN